MKQIQDFDGRLRTRLETWGEISQHLGVEIRTAQRWEGKMGLPVRRLAGSQAVFAFADELDAWRQSREKKADPPPAPVDAPTVRVGGWMGWAAVAGLVAVVGAAAAVAPAWLQTAPTPEPSVIGLEGSNLVASAASGDRLWAHNFGEPTTMLSGVQDRPLMDDWWQRADVDGDGADEVVVVVAHSHPGESMPRDRLYVFSLDGTLRFKWEPDLTVTFRERSYRAPWRVMDVEVVVADHRVWVALANTPWWPGVVVSLDVGGQSTVRFVQPGVIQLLRQVATDYGPVVLASGVNNEYASASAAFLDPISPPATAPQGGDGPFRCLNCPTGAPLKYVLFSPSFHNHAAGFPYNRADGAEAANPTRISTWEALNGPAIIYEVSNGLDIVSATAGDGYWTGGVTPQDPSWIGRDPRMARIRTWTMAAGWMSQDLAYRQSGTAGLPAAAPTAGRP